MESPEKARLAAATTGSQLAPLRHIAVIPCRWGSSRFPGKPLAGLGDKPLLWHVYQRWVCIR
ncbi:cytidylyltransferase domain-containing protein [Streptomyces sp. H27-D2]|uniref:cytidylyltransferase domain-containing protein n=1 Tax=Streptomyces sp. H27-D2 TaxID=3046304 RepID=UPI002DBB62C5|nr:hypothetical protein [Streptomyces sp. H27-D2]MEC4020472.1 hypothetical protein [Streptomyces sp. H27-D2]